jgi:hypothetical protein
MISRSLSQRLKRLEARTMPTVGEAMVIEVRFVSPDKVATGSLMIEIAPLARAALPRGPARRLNS